ncbi:MAG: DUF1036 domain-containing protein [Holophagaceae bacterium]|nr:DUF1036 domain-containing protein [Holophagaceae bacterium]
MNWLGLMLALPGFAMGSVPARPEPPPKTAAGAAADPALRFLEMALASQRLKEQKGGPKQGFYLLIENLTTDPIQVAFAVEGSGLPHTFLFEDDGLVQGWWKVEPGKTRRIFIDRVLPKVYYLHARTATHFWGKDKAFAVPSGDGEPTVTFSRYESGAKGQVDADGTVVCTHRYRQ